MTVALSGDGGDEAFGGYTFRYLPHAHESRIRARVPAALRSAVFGAAAASDVERGAVVRAGADKRQTQRDVDAFGDPQVFHRDQAVVVGHRHHQVELARVAGRVARAHEHRVRRERSLRVDALGARRSDRRRDEAKLLVAEQAALAGMRIEPSHCNARRGLAPGCGTAVGNAQRLQHGVEIEHLDGPPQRHMDGDQHHPQFVIGQHHAHRRAAGRGLQHLGMAWEVHARRGQRLLVDRRGDDRRDLAAQGQRRGSLDAQRGCSAGVRLHPAHRQIDQVGPADALQARRLPHRDAIGRCKHGVSGGVEADHRQQQAAVRRSATHHRHVADHQRCAGGAGSDGTGDGLGADAAGVAHRQRQQGCACRLGHGWRRCG